MQEMETALSPQYHLTMMMKTVINLIIYIYHYDEVCVLNAFSAFPLQLFFSRFSWDIMKRMMTTRPMVNLSSSKCRGRPIPSPNPPDSQSSSDKKYFPTRGKRFFSTQVQRKKFCANKSFDNLHFLCLIFFSNNQLLVDWVVDPPVFSYDQLQGV